MTAGDNTINKKGFSIEKPVVFKGTDYKIVIEYFPSIPYLEAY